MPNLEVLIHSLDGEFVDTVTTDENGQLALSEIPANHYFTINPYQEGFSSDYVSIKSIQKELSKAGKEYYVSNYSGETVDCVTVEHDEDEYEQNFTIDTDLDNIETLPSSYPNQDGTLELWLDAEAPGIFAFNDEFSEYAFISREDFDAEGSIVITSDMFQPFENLKSLEVTSRYAETEAMWIVDGYNYFEGPEFDNEEPENFPLDLPQNVNQVMVDSFSGEHIELNNFAYGSVDIYNTDSDIKIEAMPADSFVMGDFDGQTLTYTLNGFTAHLAYAEKYLSTGEFSARHTVLTLNPSNTLSMPSILKEPKLVDLRVEQSFALMELDNPSNIDLDDIDMMGGKVIAPITEELGFPDF